MPVLTGVDLAQVSTAYTPLPAGLYRTRIKAEIGPAEKTKHVIIRHTVLEGGDGEQDKRTFSDFVYLDKKNGERNETGWKQLKRYFEAALGEDGWDPTAPNTDLLEDTEVMVELEQESYTPPATEGNPQPQARINNKVKRVVSV